MYRYEPLKSSVWGHALRKMPAARAMHLLEKFLETAAQEYAFSDADLDLLGCSDYVADFERVLGVPAQHKRFDRLTQQQCEQCVQEIIKDEQAGGTKAGSCILTQSFNVSRWKSSEQTIDTPSYLSMYYGQNQYLSITLQFASEEDFRRVQQILADIGLCKLNEKHLKLVQERKARK